MKTCFMFQPIPTQKATARLRRIRSRHAVAVVKETDEGIIVRGAKFETAAAYANQAFTKPTIANWGDAAVRLRGWVYL